LLEGLKVMTDEQVVLQCNTATTPAVLSADSEQLKYLPFDPCTDTCIILKTTIKLLPRRLKNLDPFEEPAACATDKERPVLSFECSSYVSDLRVSPQEFLMC